MEIIADLFKVLAEPFRLRILQALQEGEKSVGELRRATGGSQPNVSKHLKVLAQAHWVGRRREGNTVYYFIEDDLVFKLCNLVCEGMERRLQKQVKVFRPARQRAV